MFRFRLAVPHRHRAQHDGPQSGRAKLDAACPDRAFHTAAAVVSYQDGGACWPPARGPPRRIKTKSCGGQWVLRPVGGYHRVIAGIAALDHGAVACQQRRAGSAERCAAEMGHEHAGGGHMPPAEVAGTQAKVVLLAIALGEQVLAQCPHGIEALAPDIHAEAHGGRDLDRDAPVHPRRQGRQPACVRLGRDRVVAAGLGIADQGCVVGQRRGGADIRLRMNQGAQGRQPAARHQRVAVQQHDVVGRRRAQPGVRRCREAAADRPADQRYGSICGQPVERQRQRGFRRRVIDCHDPRAGWNCGPHAGDALERHAQSAMDWDHHHDRPVRRRFGVDRRALDGGRDRCPAEDRGGYARKCPATSDAMCDCGREALFGTEEQRASGQGPPIGAMDMDRSRMDRKLGQCDLEAPGPHVRA